MPMSINTPTPCTEYPARRLNARGGGERAARREHVVDQHEPARARLHFEHAVAVLEVVRDIDDRRRQLALLADRHEALATAIGERRREDETARLDARDGVDAAHSAP